MFPFTLSATPFQVRHSDYPGPGDANYRVGAKNINNSLFHIFYKVSGMVFSKCATKGKTV